jgi:hypothetical protein
LGAADAIRLGKNTGTLLKYPGSDDKHRACLFVGGAFNANRWRPFVDTLARHFSAVYVLEPRGFGPDTSEPSLGSFMLSIKFAYDKVA